MPLVPLLSSIIDPLMHSYIEIYPDRQENQRPDSKSVI